MIASLFRLALGGAAVSALSVAAPANANSSDACAIWICLPASFLVSECAPAYSAMVERLVRGRSPLPGFGSCFGDDRGAQEWTTRRGPACRAGYELIDLRGEDLVRDVTDEGFFRRGQDEYLCIDPATQDSYRDSRLYTVDEITLFIDGDTYRYTNRR